MRKIFRIIVAIPCWIFLQSVGTLAFTLFGIVPTIGLFVGIGFLVSYMGTGNKEDLEESVFSLKMILTLFGGSSVTWSWIQIGNFDIDNMGLTHLKSKSI